MMPPVSRPKEMSIKSYYLLNLLIKKTIYHIRKARGIKIYEKWNRVKQSSDDKSDDGEW